MKKMNSNFRRMKYRTQNQPGHCKEVRMHHPFTQLPWVHMEQMSKVTLVLFCYGKNEINIVILYNF